MPLLRGSPKLPALAVPAHGQSAQKYQIITHVLLPNQKCKIISVNRWRMCLFVSEPSCESIMRASVSDHSAKFRAQSVHYRQQYRRHRPPKKTPRTSLIPAGRRDFAMGGCPLRAPASISNWPLEGGNMSNQKRAKLGGPARGFKPYQLLHRSGFARR